MRVYVALDIDEAIRERIARFVEGVRRFAPEARWVRPESLHVTLKFIGEKPNETVEQIEQALISIHGERIELTFRGYGFFPTAKAARVFWIGVQGGPKLVILAKAVEDIGKILGVPQEDHPFSPHLTLARGAGGSGARRRQKGDGPKQGFRSLQEKLAALPASEFGTMTAREFFLYESQLARGGAQYTKMARFELA